MPSASASSAQSPPHTPKSVELVSVAVAVAFRDVSTSALVDLTWSVADATRVEFAHAVVDVVTDAIGIGVFSAVTATHAEGVELVSVAVAVSFRDVRTTTLVDLAWAVADAARVEFAHAVVYVVTDAIGIGVFSAVTTTFAKSVELVSVAVAVAFGMSAHPHS